MAYPPPPLWLTVQAERQAEEEVSEGIPEGDRLRKAIRKYAAERYAQKQVCNHICLEQHKFGLPLYTDSKSMSKFQCYCRSVLSLAGSCLNCFISEDSKVTVQTHSSVHIHRI